MPEKWKNIKNYSAYECSDGGRIRNDKRIMKQTIDLKGYAYISLNDNQGKHVTESVHKLIATTWLENPDNKKTVDHINRVRNDNRVKNLQWATHEEQATNQKERTINHGRTIWKLDLQTNERIKCYMSLAEAASDNNIKRVQRLSMCALGKIGSAHGFKWEYEKIVDNQIEEWKLYHSTIKSKYHISNNGRVKNKDRILKPVHDAGYLAIKINDKYLFMHTLVATLFLENPNNYKEVNHKDGDKQNNHVDNLEWISHSDNMIHAIENNLKSNVRKVVNFDNKGNIIKIYLCPTYAGRELNIPAASINCCCRGRYDACGKDRLYFKYLDDTDDVINMKISDEYLKNKFKPKIRNPNLRPVKIDVYDENDNLLETCKSKVEAGRKYKCCVNTINRHIKHPEVIDNYKYKFKVHVD